MDFNSRQVSNNHPVRFYKIVAMAFLLISLVLFGFIIFMSSKRATITVMTKSEQIEVTETVSVNDSDNPANIVGTVVTTTFAFEKTFEPTGTQKIDDVATGVATLHNDSGIAQPLVVITRLLNSDGVLFRMAEARTVPANGTIDVPVYADQKGAGGNIGPAEFTIPGLSAARQKQVYATSKDPMTGGVKQIGVLSAADIEEAQNSAKALFEEETRKKMQEEYPDQTGVLEVSNVAVSTDGVEGAEVTGFTVTVTGEVLAIYYSEEELKMLADGLLQRRAVDTAEIIEPSVEAPAATLVSHDLAAGTAVFDIVYYGQAMINPGSDKLDKSVFYGKSKDEVRRYAMSLDHVTGVEIDFSPAWMRKVPHVADHVSVTVLEKE